MSAAERNAEIAQAVRTVYREGDRIRDTSGRGYHDRVSDADIRRHMRENVDDWEFMTFAKAVLAIREFEHVYTPGQEASDG